ncbi:AAA family ATPase [Nocardia farcinica]|uniref:AAA family ATPase n=1 Tax=Nocardia farcinica TaxID=37329 RepID=UPI001B3C9CE0|nr:AAA family ATPase [Nocardia farcinica]MBF6536864.1 AAA family ATPase [Nocardia farcinica]
MSVTAYDRLVSALQAAGCTVVDKGDHGSASTPGHSAADRGTTFRRYEDGVLLWCHNADREQVLAELGITQADLFDSPRTTYAYPDGRAVTRLFRNGKRQFAQSGNKAGTALFGSDALPADTTTTVYVVEGEKDVLAARAVGAAAVSQAQGAAMSPGKADWSPLAERPVVVVADADDPGRARAEKVVQHLRRIAASVTLAEPKDGKDLADHIAAGHGLADLVVIGQATPPRRLKITRGSEVQTKRVRWVDQDWIPAGSLVLLAGREGLGKSTIAASKCAQITRGTLEGEWYGTPRNVIYLHTEDARDFTVVPRLRAAGADLDRVLFIDVVSEYSETDALVLPDDIGELERVVVAEDVAFIVLDAATSAMSSDLSGKDDRQVRQFLEPLSQMAARRDCVVLGLCHFGKRDGNDTGKLILGSIAWSQVARSVLSVAKDEDTGNLIVTNTKANLAPRTRSMEAVIESTTVPTDDGLAEVGVLRWLGETTVDARDLLGGPVDDTDVVERSEAEQVILAYLEDRGGSAPAADVLKHARAVGLSDNATKKARIKAKVRTERQGFGKGASWVWTIDAPIDSIDSHSRERAPMEPMAESSPPSEVPAAASPADPCPVCGLTLGAIAAPDGIHPDCRRKRLQSIDGGAA